MLLTPSLALQLVIAAPRRAPRIASAWRRFPPGAFIAPPPAAPFPFAAPLLGLAPATSAAGSAQEGVSLPTPLRSGILTSSASRPMPQPGGVKSAASLRVSGSLAQDNQVTGEALAQARRLGDREQLGQPRLHLLAIMPGGILPLNVRLNLVTRVLRPVSCDMLYSEKCTGFQVVFQCRASRAGLSVARYPGRIHEFQAEAGVGGEATLQVGAHGGGRCPEAATDCELSSARQTLARPTSLRVEP